MNAAAFDRDALEVVNDPNRFADRTGLRILAWAMLMTQRGKRVNQFRLDRMQRSMPAATMLTGTIPIYGPPIFDGAA
jgi:hypothetical protein